MSKHVRLSKKAISIFKSHRTGDAIIKAIAENTKLLSKGKKVNVAGLSVERVS